MQGARKKDYVSATAVLMHRSHDARCRQVLWCYGYIVFTPLTCLLVLLEQEALELLELLCVLFDFKIKKKKKSYCLKLFFQNLRREYRLHVDTHQAPTVS